MINDLSNKAAQEAAKPPPTKKGQPITLPVQTNQPIQSPEATTQQPLIKREFLVYVAISPKGSAKFDWNTDDVTANQFGNPKKQLIPPQILNNPNSIHEFHSVWSVIVNKYKPGTDINEYFKVMPSGGTTYSLSAVPFG